MAGFSNVVIHVHHHIVSCIRHFESFWSLELMSARVTSPLV